MNPKFQGMVSDLLKKDSAKIRAFQKTTDALRAGNLSPTSYIKEVESVFGVKAAEKVLLPLINELPERSVAAKLAEAYKKK